MPLHNEYMTVLPLSIEQQPRTAPAISLSERKLRPNQNQASTDSSVFWQGYPGQPSTHPFDNPIVTSRDPAYVLESNADDINVFSDYDPSNYNYLTPYFSTELMFEDEQNWASLNIGGREDLPTSPVLLAENSTGCSRAILSAERQASTSSYPEFRNVVGPSGALQSCFSNAEDASCFLNKALFKVKHSAIPSIYIKNQIWIVEMFYNAMVSLEHVLDESFEVKNFRNGRYSKEEIEAACWRLADLLYELHQSDKNENIGERHEPSTRPDENLCFVDRVNSLCHMLATRKTACGEIINADLKLLNIIRAPQAHSKRKTMNQRSNAQKAIKLRIANAQLATRKASGEQPIGN